MAIDFSHVDQNALEIPDYNADVAYLRQHAKAFVKRIDAQEWLNTTQALVLPAGTWNIACVLLPANVVVKISPWDDQFEADFLKLASTVHAPVPACMGYGKVPDAMLPHASYVIMQHIEHAQTAGRLLDAGKLSHSELQAIGRKLGLALAQLHRLTFPYVRNFNNADSDWGTCLGLWELTETPLFNAGLLSQFENILERTEYREQSRGTLTHSDANLHNILVDSDTHAFRALIDPGPQIVGLPMHDLAVATQPWKYGVAYQDSVIENYQATGCNFDAALFNTSLLCAAYQLSKYNGHATDKIAAHLRSHVLPALT